MKNIYTWAAKPAKRTLTVGDLKAAKGKRKFTQVTANNVEEAEAAEKAGFDMIISNAKNDLNLPMPKIGLPLRVAFFNTFIAYRHPASFP